MLSPHQKRLSLLLCAVLHGLNHAFHVILPPLYLDIRDDLGIGRLGPIMLLGTVYLVTYAAVSLPYGILGDRFSKRKILVFGAALNSLAFFIAASTRSYPIFVTAMILAGLGGGSYHPVATALISNLFRGMVGRALGFIGMGASLGLFAGPIASGIIGQHFGWRMSCVGFAAFGCVVAVAFGLLMPEEDKVRMNTEKSREPLRLIVIALLPIVLIFGMRDFCLWGATYLTPAMTQMNLGFSSQAAGTLIGLMSLMGLISQPVGGSLSDRIGRCRVLFIALLTAGLSVLLFPYLSKTLIFPFAMICGLMLLGTVPVADAAAADIVPPSHRGRVFGATMTFGIMLGAVSPYVTGVIHDAVGGYKASYLILGLMALAGSAVVFTITSKRAHA